ncbi:hypothetical protein ASA1KI_14650 [Opitutales bacterium ASA1]|uniref:tetratricopeptide repeat protein n=1 Tax=Congregicoccus parvus TaxID=3081749 RepID=UPI002B2E1D4D|nr:hypothetical protein ASA1KI_14650 [Opitutales bacterium ASA1]
MASPRLRLPFAALASALACIVFAATPAAFAADPAPRSESLAWRQLREAAAREKAIWDRLRAAPDDVVIRKRAETDFRDLITAYENVIRAAPEMAEAYAAYGLLLGRTGNREDSTKALLKANQLDPNIPMVKNQLGNILAEDGNYNQALAYYLSAVELDEDEPLYHYQLGSLLHAYADFFLDDKTFDRATLDAKTHAAFRRAAELAPDNWPYIYRFAESFYDLEEPDWPGALAEWRRLETKAPEGLGKQTIRLHVAGVLHELGQTSEARTLLATIDEPALAEQKQTVVARIEESEGDAP